MGPFISVIMPAYNAEKWISYAIKSIQNQTYANWELIIIDDGSIDNTADVCKAFAKEDPRIQVYTQTNRGPSAARNNGLSHMKGDYFTIIDCDDILNKCALEKYISAAEKSGAETVICGYKFVNKLNNTQKRYTLGIEKEFQVESGNINIKPIGDIICRGLMASNWNKLYKNTLSHLRFNEELSLNEDVLFSLVALAESQKVIVIPDVLYEYQIQNTQSVSLKFHPELMDALEALEKQLIKNQAKPLRKEIAKWLSDYIYIYIKAICINPELKGKRKQFLLDCTKKTVFKKYVIFSNADTINRKIGTWLLKLKMLGLYIAFAQLKKRG